MTSHLLAASALVLAAACGGDAIVEPNDAGHRAAPATTLVSDADDAAANVMGDEPTMRSNARDAASPSSHDSGLALAVDAGLGAALIAEAGASSGGEDGSMPSAATEAFTLGVADAFLDGRNVVIQVRTDEPVSAESCTRAEVIPLDPEQRDYVELVREMDHGDWYVDGAYEPLQTNLGCDAVACAGLTEFRFSIDRVEEIGRAPRPPDLRRGAPLSDVALVTEQGVEVNADAGAEGWVPVYASRVLSGTVFVRHRYHRDESCDGDASLFEQRIALDDLE